jgi:hypothetical protein
MTEIKSGKSQDPDSPPACRCRCEYDPGGPWFPLELDTEQAGYQTGGCACGCGGANDFSVNVFAVF